VHVRGIEAAVLGHGLGDDLLDLPARQAAQVADDRLQRTARDLDLDGTLAVGAPERIADEPLDLDFSRQRHRQRRRVFAQHVRQFLRIVQHHELTAGVAELPQQVAQHAQRPLVPQVRNQVKCEADGTLRQRRQMHQRFHGPIGIRHRRGPTEQPVLHAPADRPQPQRAVEVHRGVAYQPEDVILLKRTDGDARRSTAQELFQLCPIFHRHNLAATTSRPWTHDSRFS